MAEFSYVEHSHEADYTCHIKKKKTTQETQQIKRQEQPSVFLHLEYT